jgi:murein DD-endopeptidase MepM/ murein hydrolase activator NlpD
MEADEPIHAMRGGEVVYVEESLTETSDPYKVEAGEEPWKPANSLAILHQDGTIGWYGHMPQNGVVPEVGDLVRRGERVGRIGNTGNSTGPHLHFQSNGKNTYGKSTPILIEHRTPGSTKVHHCVRPAQGAYETTNRRPGLDADWLWRYRPGS